MSFPDDKETFPRREDKNLAEGKTGDKITAADHNDTVEFLELLEDVLGIDFNSTFNSHKLRHDDIDTQISGAGDFKKDGSVPMTGNLDVGGNDLENTKKIEAKSTVENVDIIADSQNDNAPTEQARGRVIVKSSVTGIEGIFEATREYGDIRIRASENKDLSLCHQNDQFIVLNGADNKITIYKPITYAGNGDIYFYHSGKGLQLTTPDGNHIYRVRIDNSGNVVTDLIS